LAGLILLLIREGISRMKKQTRKVTTATAMICHQIISTGATAI
jgi:hypothetical protein